MMSMGLSEEYNSGNYSNDQMLFVKGKRTKRPRPSSSASSSGSVIELAATHHRTTAEEDELDMANCLILLASGGSPPLKNKLSSSRKFNEIDVVYECKTCNKIFQSFQALGGHRASHKRAKPDIYPEEEKKVKLIRVLNTEELGNKSSFNHEISRPSNKIHECSVCGSEFGSGQALGGHMRRHRSSSSTTNSNIITNISTSTRIVDNDTRFNLDLNLPAPVEEEEASFHQFSSNHHRFFTAAPPLVDCHY